MALKNYIGISRDHSRSMYNITRSAARDYNDNVAAIKEAAIKNNLDTIVSVVKCGVGPCAQVLRETINSNVNVLRPIPEHGYIADGSGTPLFDSIGELIELFKTVPDANDPEVSFVIMVITDGEENRSQRWPAVKLAEEIRRLQASDRWTFVFRVPRGYSRTLVNFGIHPGNILEWDQTEHGVEVASAATRSAFTQFYDARAKGVTSTNKFYADLSQVSLTEVRTTLNDISGQIKKYFVEPALHGIAIKDFTEQHGPHIPYRAGTMFYQLSKTEKVQDYKKICISDKKTGAIYTGIAARNLLNVPHYGQITLASGRLGDYDVFIQSTSVNRKLVGGTSVLYWSFA